jgi:deazaflavin-dependent oxidoreductase (nitroreductase family)
MAAWDQEIIAEFRANQGKVGGHYAGYDLLLLTMVGAKSGLRRTKPVVYIRDRDRFVVVASKGGAATNPDWYHNLRTHPAVTVETGTDIVEAIAEVVPPGAEHDRLYRAMADTHPVFADYARRAGRVIPVVTLTPTPEPRWSSDLLLS